MLFPSIFDLKVNRLPSLVDERFMRLAIQKAREGLRKGQSPFGVCIVKGGRSVVSVHNRVWEATDITAHAEIVAIRAACDRLKTVNLSGCTLYSTAEPCPMCFGAIHWARIDRIVYGATINDGKRAGFNELSLSNNDMKRLGGAAVEVEPGVLREECQGLFEEWSRLGNLPY